MHESKTTEGLTLKWAGRKLVVLRALRVAREPEAVTHWERLHKNKAFSKAHRNFCREILPLETGQGNSPHLSHQGADPVTALPEEEFTIVQLVVSSLAKNGITGD